LPKQKKEKEGGKRQQTDKKLFPKGKQEGGNEMKRLLVFFVALMVAIFFTGLTMAGDRGGGRHGGNHSGSGRGHNDPGFRGGGHFDREPIDRGYFRGGHDHFRGGYYSGYYGGWSGWDYGRYSYWVPGCWILQWDPYYGRWLRIWIPGYWRYSY
jgi:hypothetical protein